MKLLVIGGGGREHALAWKLAQSSRVSEVLVAPGNAGTAMEPKCRNIAVRADDIDALLQLAADEDIALTVVGPEGPLVGGVVDRFQAAGRRIFGPRAAAAQLEGSKAYAKDFLARHRIPTAYYTVFADLDIALDHVRDHFRDSNAPTVIKADGLAAGKGVVVAMSLDEAEQALNAMLADNAFGDAGARVVIEEFLEGEEASFICMVDGRTALPMASSQDHKRVLDGDRGPNTGGMGAYSPAPVITPAIHQRIMREVIEPTVAGMAADGEAFTGFLYAGLMINAHGQPKVIEFNVRFGDPETQPIMLRLRSDLVDLIDAALDDRLDHAAADWDPRASLGVVIAAGGYPGSVRGGDAIDLPHDSHDAGAVTKLFHAGTALDGDTVVTAGGRVLCACGLGDSVAEAASRAYELAGCVRFDGAFLRRDIGYRAIAREGAEHS